MADRQKRLQAPSDRNGLETVVHAIPKQTTGPHRSAGFGKGPVFPNPRGKKVRWRRGIFLRSRAPENLPARAIQKNRKRHHERVCRRADFAAAFHQRRNHGFHEVRGVPIVVVHFLAQRAPSPFNSGIELGSQRRTSGDPDQAASRSLDGGRIGGKSIAIVDDNQLPAGIGLVPIAGECHRQQSRAIPRCEDHRRTKGEFKWRKIRG